MKKSFIEALVFTLLASIIIYAFQDAFIPESVVGVREKKMEVLTGKSEDYFISGKYNFRSVGGDCEAIGNLIPKITKASTSEIYSYFSGFDSKIDTTSIKDLWLVVDPSIVLEESDLKYLGTEYVNDWCYVSFSSKDNKKVKIFKSISDTEFNQYSNIREDNIFNDLVNNLIVKIDNRKKDENSKLSDQIADEKFKKLSNE